MRTRVTYPHTMYRETSDDDSNPENSVAHRLQPVLGDGSSLCLRVGDEVRGGIASAAHAGNSSRRHARLRHGAGAAPVDQRIQGVGGETSGRRARSEMVGRCWRPPDIMICGSLYPLLSRGSDAVNARYRNRGEKCRVISRHSPDEGAILMRRFFPPSRARIRGMQGKFRT